MKIWSYEILYSSEIKTKKSQNSSFITPVTLLGNSANKSDILDKFK